MDCSTDCKITCSTACGLDFSRTTGDATVPGAGALDGRHEKLADIDSTIAWFGNPDWGLGLPMPEPDGWAAALTEAGGAIALLIGLATRWISIPLMVTMVVAAVTVHWDQGWLPLPAETPESAERLPQPPAAATARQLRLAPARVANS